MMNRRGVIFATFLAFAAEPAIAGMVEYDVTFDATWSAATHPLAYPSGAHFSPLIGSTHNAEASFWQAGGLATPGIEQMAELGGRTLLRGEIESAIAAGRANSLILGSGISSPAAVTLRFEIDADHPLVTLVTMVAPSPDWFVGVSGLSLRQNDAWIESLVVDLHAYDAGTDSGSAFTSPNADTQPPELIQRLGAPFDGTPPLGTFTFTLIPEPTSLALVVAGLVGVVGRSRSKRNVVS